MVRWARDPAFSGGCCADCKPVALDNSNRVELGEQYRDICNCCLEKEECRQSDSCKCSVDQTAGKESPVNVTFDLSLKGQCSH